MTTDFRYCTCQEPRPYRDGVLTRCKGCWLVIPTNPAAKPAKRREPPHNAPEGAMAAIAADVRRGCDIPALCRLHGQARVRRYLNRYGVNHENT